jgi:hypothetical protein
VTGTKLGTSALSAALIVLLGLELFTFAELAWWGSTLATAPAVRTIGAVAALAAATSLWATFAAPRARVRIPALTVAVKTLVFGATVTTLVSEDHPQQAAGFVAVLALTTAAVRLLNHHPTPLRPNAHTSVNAHTSI